MKQPITIYLIALAGTGKYTIGKELAKSGYKLVDNHLINNPIFSLLDLDGKTSISEKAWVYVRKIREVVLDFVSQDLSSHYVFTNELCEEENDRRVYRLVKDAADKRGAIFVPVKLLISPNERKKRIVSEDRSARFKCTNHEEVHQKKDLINIDEPFMMELDVSTLTSVEAASAILSHVETLKDRV